MFTAGPHIAGSWQGLGLLLLETIAALAVIALACFALVRFGGARLVRGRRPGRMRVIERLALEPRRALYLVEADGERLLVGVSEGSVSLVKAIRAAESPAERSVEDGDPP